MTIQIQGPVVSGSQQQGWTQSETGANVYNMDGHVTVTTTRGNDQIKAWQVGPIVKISINDGKPIELNTCSTKSLTIHGAGGTDTLCVDSSVIFPIQIKDCKRVDAIEIREQQLGGYLQLVQGRSPQPLANTSGMTQCADLPPPSSSSFSSPAFSSVSPKEESITWDQVLQQSNQQISIQMSRESLCQDKAKTDKLERALDAAMKSGDLDLAVLLVSLLETKKANETMMDTIGKIKNLQQQRTEIGKQLGNSEAGGANASNAAKLQNDSGAIATDISTLQTLLQESMSQKQEAQQLASNMMKSRHDTDQSILRNIA